MTALGPRSRGVARGLATIGAALSAAMFVLAMVSATSALPPGSPSSGSVTLNPATGNSGTTIQLIPPTGADCAGEAGVGWRYHTYITPIAQDPSQLAFQPNGTPGPLPTQNLRTAAGQQLRALSPAIGNNFLAQQTFSFASGAFAASVLPPGDYWIGFACTLPEASTNTPIVEEFWALAITITSEAGAGPNGFTYGPAATVETTTTTTTSTTSTTTTTTVASSSTTTSSTTPATGSTTTSTTAVGGSTSTTAAPGATTTTSVVAGAPSTTTFFAGGSTGTGSGGGTYVPPSGQLAATGADDTVRLVVWGVLFVVFGRMAILLSRKPKVVPPSGS